MPYTREEKSTWRAVRKLLKIGALEKRRNPVSGEWEFRSTYTEAEELAVVQAIHDAAPGRIEEPLLAARTGLPAEKIRIICRMLAAGFTRVQLHEDGTIACVPRLQD